MYIVDIISSWNSQQGWHFRCGTRHCWKCEGKFIVADLLYNEIENTNYYINHKSYTELEKALDDLRGAK